MPGAINLPVLDDAERPKWERLPPFRKTGAAPSQEHLQHLIEHYFKKRTTDRWCTAGGWTFL